MMMVMMMKMMMMKMMMVMMMKMMKTLMMMKMMRMTMMMMNNFHAITSTKLLTLISHHDFQLSIIATNSFSSRYMYILLCMMACCLSSFCVSI